ncbi:hypothetical protein PV11_05660 [Exophiala sideris]|uniref:J domain-containing protein n=1 Tax=Exophiala sideris TaxID=1016849 RepID=A0A0D1X760_9EURO|nr:hypothetical protein PV11_05660 [Exophiala sideris]
MSEESTVPLKSESVDDGGGHEHRSKRFRFKSRREEDPRSDEDLRRHKRSRGHESSHQSRKRHKSSRHARSESPSRHHLSYLSSDQAFRESLFDALGDDEGAAFWQGVYGQPIHNYPDTYEDEETGQLERMTEEEYAQFVRRKMWEKSWEGIEAAREEKKREREREKQKRREEETKSNAQSHEGKDDYIFDIEIEASLRRGEKRKDRKRWQALWQGYLEQWDELQDLAQHRQKLDQEIVEQLFLRNKIAWPVESGKRKDAVKDEIERFVRKSTAAAEDGIATQEYFFNAVKSERIRWHPDKIQQRYGFMKIDENTLKGVTAVFQVFDAMWNEIRNKAE